VDATIQEVYGRDVHWDSDGGCWIRGEDIRILVPIQRCECPETTPFNPSF
jgi:hypothetical protein